VNLWELYQKPPSSFGFPLSLETAPKPPSPLEISSTYGANLMDQNIFSNGLSKNLPIYAPDVSASVIINAGATHLRDVVTAEQLPGVLQAYMIAINQSFILAIVCGGFAAIFACFVEWKSVKGKKIVPAGA
jgi:hypothetical protein